MTHEKIIKRENGTQYKIYVTIYFSSYESKPVYDIELFVREKGKRKWEHTQTGIAEYEMRKLPMTERRAARVATFTNYVTQEEINSAKIEAWETMKPIIN